MLVTNLIAATKCMTEVPLKEEVLLLAHSWRGRSQLIVAGKAWQQGMVWL